MDLNKYYKDFVFKLRCVFAFPGIFTSFDVLSPEFNTGGIIYISEIDTMFILASLFGNSSWSPSVRPREMLMEDIDFVSLSIVDYTYYFSNRYPYALKSVSSGKYLSNSAYPHSSNNYDIFLAKLNLNLEYCKLPQK